MEHRMQLWLIQPDPALFKDSNVKVIIWANGREDAKRRANEGWLRGMGNPDNFVCTPLTNPGDRVKLDITLHV